MRPVILDLCVRQTNVSLIPADDEVPVTAIRSSSYMTHTNVLVIRAGQAKTVIKISVPVSIRYLKFLTPDCRISMLNLFPWLSAVNYNVHNMYLEKQTMMATKINFKGIMISLVQTVSSMRLLIHASQGYWSILCMCKSFIGIKIKFYAVKLILLTNPYLMLEKLTGCRSCSPHPVDYWVYWVHWRKVVASMV